MTVSKIVTSIQNAVAVKLPDIPMEFITSRLGYDVDRTCRRRDIFCAIRACHDPEFLDSIRVRKGATRDLVRINIICPIQRKVHTVAPHPIDRRRDLPGVHQAILKCWMSCVSSGNVLDRVRRTGRKKHQGGRLTTIQRQAFHLLLSNEPRQGADGSVNH